MLFAFWVVLIRFKWSCQIGGLNKLINLIYLCLPSIGNRLLMDSWNRALSRVLILGTSMDDSGEWGLCFLCKESVVNLVVDLSGSR